MTGILQLTEQLNPLSQTFRVTESGGSVITSIGLFFQSAPAVADPQLPISIELRPMENGIPSASRFIPGSKVTASAADIRAIASETFSSSTEYKFELESPIFIPENSEMAIVVATAAEVGQYKLWAGELTEFKYGSTTEKITHQLDAGVVYRSSNGTAWTPSQELDLAFKVYRAVFSQTSSLAVLDVDVPPEKRLTENTFFDDYTKYVSDPIVFTAGADSASIIHPAHGFIVGDKVKLSAADDGFDSADTVNGIKGSSILGSRTITAADPYGYTIALDSAATASIRAGGVGLMATEQYVIDQIQPIIPYNKPANTNIEFYGTFTTAKSFADDNATAYQTVSNLRIPVENQYLLDTPYLITSLAQENDPAKLNGSPSTTIKVKLDTSNKYVAPYINVNAANLGVISHFIDYQDSDGSSVANRNKLSTIDYVAETEANNGTNASKFITIPYTLQNSATSIRIYVDAIRPDGSDFTVWFRTNQSSSDQDIEDIGWTAFSKTQSGPNTSNYSDRPFANYFYQYEFNVFDIPSFDQYQIKITMNAVKSTRVPRFANLRTIATV
jgi:hypothetical protein